MRYLRKVEGKTRRDKIRNTVIRTQLEQTPLVETVYKNQLRWFGHLTRMDENRVPKKAFLTKAGDIRPRGRPRKTWKEEIEERLRKGNLTLRKAEELAKNSKRMENNLPQPLHHQVEEDA